MGISKGVELRLTIHNILFDINVNRKTLNSKSIKNIIENYNENDLAFINNICLNSMRYYFHCMKIIKSYTKKTPKIHEKLLLISSITQLIFLDFKDYAVVDTSVTLAKKLNIYHGFINAILRKIIDDKIKLKKIEVNFNDFPEWFRKNCYDLNKFEKINFTKTFFKEPSLHLVFKNYKGFSNFEKNITATSKNSGFIKRDIKLNQLNSYSKGTWWVQDFSSSLPLNSLSKKDFGNAIDLCAAPGGKAFQVLSKTNDIALNDVSKKRIELLKSNLKRLKFNAKILNYDILKLKLDTKYDFIILDAPCSAIGTIRRNPEIFFKKYGPNFESLLKNQAKMLNISAKLLNKKGILLYMVCSFFKSETTDQINKFLEINKNFRIDKFSLDKNNELYGDIISKNYMRILPTNIKGFKVDGYFAIYLRKIKDDVF